MVYLLLFLGFLLLIKGADLFVEGASSLSAYFNLPPLLIGLTIVAFGTSAPEASVSFVASLDGSGDLILGNIIGSNIFNILMVIGVSSMIMTIRVFKNTIIKEFPLALFSALLLFFLVHDGVISRTDGIILLLGFGVFLFYLIKMAKLGQEIDSSITDIKALPLSRTIVFLIFGLLMVIFGGNVVVNNASKIAMQWGMSEALVGITIVAIGTSLPELVTSAVAAYKGQSDIALGNIIGSNLFNVLFILGTSAVINPIFASGKFFTDIIFLTLVTGITYFFAFTKSEINKFEGASLILFYIVYMIYIIIRN